MDVQTKLRPVPVDEDIMERGTLETVHPGPVAPLGDLHPGFKPRWGDPAPL